MNKIPCTEAGYRVTDGNIAAIDFGTTSISLAFTTKGDDEINTINLERCRMTTRVSNAILLKKEEQQIKVIANGNRACTVKMTLLF